MAVANTFWNWMYAGRENLRAAKKEFNKTEDDLKSLQSVGQIIGEVLRPLDNERCNMNLLWRLCL
jgi:hypothetical protein